MTRRPELAWWAWSLGAYAIAAAAIAWGEAAGWDARAFRVYYAAGALLTAPLLGAGSLVLAGVRRVRGSRARLRGARRRDRDRRAGTRRVRRARHPRRAGSSRVPPGETARDRGEHRGHGWPSSSSRFARSGGGRSATRCSSSASLRRRPAAGSRASAPPAPHSASRSAPPCSTRASCCRPRCGRGSSRSPTDGGQTSHPLNTGVATVPAQRIDVPAVESSADTAHPASDRASNSGGFLLAAFNHGLGPRASCAGRGRQHGPRRIVAGHHSGLTAPEGPDRSRSPTTATRSRASRRRRGTGSA